MGCIAAIVGLRPIPTRLFFSDSIRASQPIVVVLRQQRHGVGRALLGMSSPTLREVPNTKIRFSIGAVRIIAD